MKCKISSAALVVAMLLPLMVEGVGAQRSGKIKFLRPLQRHWTHGAGRSDSAGTGRGLMKHFMMLRNMWQQPSSNVIIITRPTTTQNDDTTTTTGTGTRALSRQAEKDDDTEDDDDIEVLGTNTENDLKGVNDKISMESLQGNGHSSAQRKRNKKHRNSANKNSKRRKQIINVDNILKREEDRRNGLESRRNGGRRTTVKPIESSNDGGNFRRLMNSFRLQSGAVH